MNATTKRVAKRMLAHGLVRTGCWDLILRGWARRRTTLILTYHRVLEKLEPTLDYSQPGMVVTLPTFERQLSFLEQHFEIVSLGALLDEGNRPAGRPRCVITFDDGWRDNYDVAFPVLRRRGIPATIFLTTDFVGTERVFWHTDLIYLLLHGELSCLLRDGRMLAAYPAAVRDCLQRCAGQSGARRADEIDAAVETVKAACDEEVIHELIDTLTGPAGLHRPFFPERRFFLDWDQVQEMAANGFEIGSHGCSHRIMTRLSREEVEQELYRSKAEIERRVGREARHFAFPNEDASEALTRLAARAGYRTACGGVPGTGTPEPRILALRRAGMHEGVGAAGPMHEDALLGLSLLRASKSRSA